jgi:hypothetical protein
MYGAGTEWISFIRVGMNRLNPQKNSGRVKDEHNMRDREEAGREKETRKFGYGESNPDLLQAYSCFQENYAQPCTVHDTRMKYLSMECITMTFQIGWLTHTSVLIIFHTHEWSIWIHG